MVTRMIRLSASVPKHIVDEADEIAEAKKISRSQLISECLTDMIQRRKKELLAEGYKAMAEEHRTFASIAEEAAREVVPEW